MCGTYNASAVSTAITQTVNAAGTTITVASRRESPSSTFQAVTYTATVTATSPSTGNPTGSVEFLDGGVAIGSCNSQPLSDSTPDTATCQSTYTAAGSHTITAQYLGVVGSYNASASTSVTQTVNSQ